MNVQNSFIKIQKKNMETIEMPITSRIGKEVRKIHAMEYCSAIKKNKRKLHIATRMNF